MRDVAKLISDPEAKAASRKWRAEIQRKRRAEIKADPALYKAWMEKKKADGKLNRSRKNNRLKGSEGEL